MAGHIDNSLARESFLATSISNRSKGIVKIQVTIILLTGKIKAHHTGISLSYSTKLSTIEQSLKRNGKIKCIVILNYFLQTSIIVMILLPVFTFLLFEPLHLVNATNTGTSEDIPAGANDPTVLLPNS